MESLKRWIDKHPLTTVCLMLNIGLLVMVAVYKVIGGEPQNDPVFLVFMWILAGVLFFVDERRKGK